jgi:PadR family transcriptional regulator PadR
MRLTRPVQRLLMEMARDAGARHYGLEMAKATGLSSGTLYPVLARLEQAGWVTSTWEEVDPSRAGRPPRRYYRLTAVGVRQAASLREEWLQILGLGVAGAPA